MREYADVPPTIEAAVRAICMGLPEVHEQQAWVGRRWMIRKRTFAHVFAVDADGGIRTGIQFRLPEPEFGILVQSGHPFFRAGWGSNVMQMVLSEATDFAELEELLTESYCVMAPKKLAAQVGPPQQ
ncbi:MAG TPA: MmcQ/YjbR family DNA-binding protein [Acidimicrobiales bacterium]|jgi:hypothetical protein|nr:MmcQ/YjbR family DNA-binding protein [Acidimicrobiales bacterium]